MNSDMSIQGEQIAREVEKIFIDYSISRQRFHDMLKTYAQADQDVWIWGEARRWKQRRTGQHTTEEEKRLSYYALLTAVHDHYLPDEPRIIAPDLLELDESARLDSLFALPAGLESKLADAQLALKYVKADLDTQAPAAQVRELEEKTLTQDMPTLSPSNEKAYQSYNYAIEKAPDLADATDDKVYEWLKENGPSEYDLPSCDTWKRNLRSGRKHYGKNKNQPRAGRSAKSAIGYKNLNNLGEITNQYNLSDAENG